MRIKSVHILISKCGRKRSHTRLSSVGVFPQPGYSGLVPGDNPTRWFAGIISSLLPPLPHPTQKKKLHPTIGRNPSI